MKKKNGFTLVELLAVIVILAIILVIAVPSIMNTIKDARKGSLESAVKMVASAAETQYMTALTLDNVGTETGKFNAGTKDTPITCMGATWSGIKASDESYETCTYYVLTADDATSGEKAGTAHVTIKGKGNLAGYTCNGTKSSTTCS